MSPTIELLPLAVTFAVLFWCIGFVWFFLWKLKRDESAALVEIAGNFAEALYFLGRRRRAGGASLWFEASADQTRDRPS